MELISINPKNKQVIKKFEELSDKQLGKKLDQAQAAYLNWREVSLGERCKLMSSAAKVLRDNKDKYARIITDEMGKTLSAAAAEIEKCAATCDYYAEHSQEFLKPEIIETDASQSYARFDPIGIILAIMPWNFPFWQVFRFAAPALCAGNVGILKHAANVQMSAFAIEEVFREAGFPEGCFSNLPIKVEKVEQIIKDKRVRAVTLTGSEKAGAIVAAQAGKQLKKSVMELGGSDPFIVLQGADIDAAIEAAVTARMQYNSGQSCISAKRFIVEQPVYHEFLDKLKIQVDKLVVGDPLDSKTNLGPMANDKMLDGIDQQVQQSISQGAELIAGGKSLGDEGYFFEPTILAGQNLDLPIFAEETFGPVFAVTSVKDPEQAVKVANSSQYGLGSTIFTDDVDFAKENLAPKIDCGAVFINSQVKSDPRLPFGGVKNSGYGRELSHYGQKEFVNIKTVWIK